MMSHLCLVMKSLLNMNLCAIDSAISTGWVTSSPPNLGSSRVSLIILSPLRVTFWKFSGSFFYNGFVVTHFLPEIHTKNSYWKTTVNQNVRYVQAINFARHSRELATLCERISSVRFDRYILDAAGCVGCVAWRLRFILFRNRPESPRAHGTDAVLGSSTALWLAESLLLLSNGTAIFRKCVPSDCSWNTKCFHVHKIWLLFHKS